MVNIAQYTKLVYNETEIKKRSSSMKFTEFREKDCICYFYFLIYNKREK